ncbi:MAG: hypothetical protein JST62_12940 [Bacteroidetes bacterium]|nr:hypothetical protein [Bacteroidota bacterium]
MAKTVILFSILFFPSLLFSQTEKDSLQFPKEKNLYNTKDMADVYHSIFKKHKKTDTISSRKADFAILPAAGYTLQTGFAGVISANMGFHTKKNENQKISNINTSVTYTQYKQILAPFYANIWFPNNHYNWISDMKYMDYPSDVYGLNSRRLSTDANSNEGYGISYRFVKIHESVLRTVFENFYLGGGFYYDQFWDIKIIDTEGNRVNRLLTRQLSTNEKAVGVVAKAMYDSRLNQINPSNGWYANVVFNPSFSFLGSTKDWSTLQIDVRKYFHFPANSQNVLAFWGFAWLTTSNNHPSYLFLPSTAWDDQYNTGRGYIQSRFRGKNMLYYENEYRFNLTKNGLLGGVVFGNVQTFSGDLSTEYRKLMVGYGLGLRVKLNKKTGTNVCIDYGFGDYNSRGFFVNLGEVF